jgi:DNA primase
MSKTLLEVLHEQGLTPLPSGGGRFVLSCPFHEGDESPSFTVYETGTYYCFGCKVWGDAYKFLIDKGWEHRAAIEYLGEDYRIINKERPGIIKVKNLTEAYGVLNEATEAYHKFLLSTVGAYQYLLNRGLTDETIRSYRLGYSDGYVLRLNWASEASIAKQIGLVSTAGYELLSHRICIPNSFGDKERGHALVDFIVGRTVTNEKVKYLGIRLPKPLYGFYEVRQSQTIFVTEGQFDWLTLRQWGYPAVSVGGGNNNQLLPIKDKQVVIVPDNDEVGMRNAKKIKEMIPTSIILDYAKLGVKDVSELAIKAHGRDDFASIVKELSPWTIPILEMPVSYNGLSLQSYKVTVGFPLISKPRDSLL